VQPQLVSVTLPGNQPPWTSTGLCVEAGDRVTLLGSGVIRWLPNRDVGAGAKYHLWGRVPGGQIFGCTQDTATVTVDRSGELQLCVYIGAWADRLGTLATGTGPYQRTRGGLQVTVIRWPADVDPVASLGLLDDPRVDPALVDAELTRLRHPVERPPGWTHLLDFGETDIYRAARVDGRPAIDVVCDNDAGILQTPCELPLDPSTHLEWTWRVDCLPSVEPENTTWTHDYLSIAVEFDNGRDLTWLWSSALEPVTGTFDCPVRSWTARETHMPVRRGQEELGRFHRERRPVWEDYRRFMGVPPARVVRVWLIAVSHFSRRLGRATYTDIRLSTADRTIQIL
jgi:Protein of unknown function (DUF3047)